MKLERLDEYLTTATAVVVRVGIAYWCGLLAGAGSFGTLTGILAGMLFGILLLILRQHIWMLIPAMWSLSGQLPGLKGGLALRDVVIAGVAVATFTLIAFKIVNRKPKYTAIDFWLWASMLYLCITFLRNPTGGYVLNSDRIGGRAYLNAAVALVAFWVLARMRLPSARAAKGLIIATVGVRLAIGFLNLAANFFPRIVPLVSRYYAGIDISAFESEEPSDLGAEAPARYTYLIDIGEPILRWQLAAFRPFQLINPLYALVSPKGFLIRLIWGLCLGLIALTGFRSMIFTLAIYFALTALLKQGLRDVFKIILVDVLVVALLVIVQSTIVPLPMPAQRALSFLPGRWDPAMVADAQNSSQWRFYMWSQMLTTDRYIQNRWLGDGFGFSMWQYQLMLAAAKSGDPRDVQESFMIVGQVHSGPVSTVRFVGYLGLLLYYVLIGVLCREAWRLCKEARGTAFETVVFFFCIPVIWQPFGFTLIFGAYDSDLPATIFAAGMIKMLRNTLDHHLQPAENAAPEQPAAPPRMRPQRRFAPAVRRLLWPPPTAKLEAI